MKLTGLWEAGGTHLRKHRTPDGVEVPSPPVAANDLCDSGRDKLLSLACSLCLQVTRSQLGPGIKSWKWVI
jgi:hypothetical protein